MNTKIDWTISLEIFAALMLFAVAACVEAETNEDVLAEDRVANVFYIDGRIVGRITQCDPKIGNSFGKSGKPNSALDSMDKVIFFPAPITKTLFSAGFNKGITEPITFDECLDALMAYNRISVYWFSYEPNVILREWD